MILGFRPAGTVSIRRDCIQASALPTSRGGFCFGDRQGFVNGLNVFQQKLWALILRYLDNLIPLADVYLH